ncbi:uncharacterized protein CLUP02_12247 [Colletotrichum lupini]|uniref:Uncharacterized protein n=1 Tax=Colletotrichum lupini TaxID=145971 RepID=A0A9Q8T0J9_9PEZI|nr:uncharacterized protein CLUP02_12247 [Colletotrichum lupini]UQC86745.1 hypothetical protein CLUP02_12247 [Colletotrichum lupini]
MARCQLVSCSCVLPNHGSFGNRPPRCCSSCRHNYHKITSLHGSHIGQLLFCKVAGWSRLPS